MAAGTPPISEKVSEDPISDVEKGLKAAPEDSAKDVEEEFPNWKRIALIMLALMLAMFLVALVRICPWQE
jgi:hypothetical protein